MKIAEFKAMIFLSMMVGPTVLLGIWYGKIYSFEPVFFLGIVSWMVGFAGVSHYLNKYVEGKK